MLQTKFKTEENEAGREVESSAGNDRETCKGENRDRREKGKRRRLLAERPRARDGTLARFDVMRFEEERLRRMKI
jgi:hypothetical protein